jgi:hypothetical protein
VKGEADARQNDMESSGHKSLVKNVISAQLCLACKTEVSVFAKHKVDGSKPFTRSK